MSVAASPVWLPTLSPDPIHTYGNDCLAKSTKNDDPRRAEEVAGGAEETLASYEEGSRDDEGECCTDYAFDEIAEAETSSNVKD